MTIQMGDESEAKQNLSRVISALFSPDGTCIITASWDKTTRVGMWSRERTTPTTRLYG